MAQPLLNAQQTRERIRGRAGQHGQCSTSRPRERPTGTASTCSRVSGCSSAEGSPLPVRAMWMARRPGGVGQEHFAVAAAGCHCCRHCSCDHYVLEETDLRVLGFDTAGARGSFLPQLCLFDPVNASLLEQVDTGNVSDSGKGTSTLTLHQIDRAEPRGIQASLQVERVRADASGVAIRSVSSRLRNAMERDE